MNWEIEPEAGAQDQCAEREVGEARAHYEKVLAEAEKFRDEMVAARSDAEKMRARIERLITEFQAL